MFEIVEMTAADWREVRAIYAEGLSSGVAAFMTRPPLWKAFVAGHLAVGRLVARDGGAIVGWAALGPVADT